MTILSVDLQSPFSCLALQRRCFHVEGFRGVLKIAVGIANGLLDLVLEFPVLNHAVKRAFADAEETSRFLAVAVGCFQALLHVVALHFGERFAKQIAGAGGMAVGRLQPAQGVSLLQVLNAKDAVAILQAVRRAAPAEATLFIIETIVPAGPEPDWSKMLDIHMLTLFGAKQRTLREYQTLLEQSGFVFQREIDTGAGIAVIEALPKET